MIENIQMEVEKSHLLCPHLVASHITMLKGYNPVVVGAIDVTV